MCAERAVDQYGVHAALGRASPRRRFARVPQAGGGGPLSWYQRVDEEAGVCVCVCVWGVFCFDP